MIRRNKRLRNKFTKLYYKILTLIIFLVIAFSNNKFKDIKGVIYDFIDTSGQRELLSNKLDNFSYKDIISLDIKYRGSPYELVNDNIPFFTNEEYESLSKTSFEKYSQLDKLGRCTVAFANIGKDIMPTEKRGKIGNIRPSGWKNKKYPGIVDGNYLYNRCHLIAYTLAGENDNPLNLITGTRYFNNEGMLPFEISTANYIRETGNHVLYRVTPVFKENNLLADGVLMEAYSVEDRGEGICFCVYVFNVQPGIDIDYLTGDSKES